MAIFRRLMQRGNDTVNFPSLDAAEIDDDR